ncbi:hypothetical protein QBC43DRAFT_319443 [Cladorrhinum sp. PSN259]|nr:hypothetical protein QBC43DRAFT_319443 [Cladorrhinum sp. PSN259]
MPSHILHRRDGESSSKLSPGAIAGIACGAGALFLAAGLLFFIYWRRDRQFDREEDYYQTRHGLDDRVRRPSAGMMPNAVSYTMDYKMDSHQKEYDGSSYTYSPDKPTYPFSPLSVSDGGAGASSAMPTHPAYIPRAFVRGAPSSNHSRTNSASTHQHLANTISSSSPPLHGSVSNNQAENPNDMLVQAYLDTASGERVASAVLLAASSPPSHSSPFPPQQGTLPGISTGPSLVPLQKPRPAAFNLQPAQAIPLPAQKQQPQSSPGYSSSSSNQNNSNTITTTSGRKPRKYVPPRLNLSGGPATSHAAKPIKGKENATISGPLAFPEHYRGPHHHRHHHRKTTKNERRRTLFAEDDDEFSESDDGDDDNGVPYDDDQQIISDSEDDSYYDERANKRRQQQEEREKAAAAAAAAKKEQSQTQKRGNRHYAEVEIGRGSDIW